MSGATRIKTAVIGAGYLGRFHSQKYHKLEQADLVAVCDTDPARARTVATENDTRPCTDYREILDKVDAVSIVVPTTEHYRVARECLEAGLDILLEKPITETLKEADELIKLADERGRIFMVGHLERFNPAIVKLSQTMVKPGFIEAQRLGPFKQRAADTDVIRDLMIHDLDIVMGFVPSEVKSVSALGLPVLSDKIDIANARIEFENGCVAGLTASRVSIGEGVRKIKIFQHENYISIDYQNQSMAVFTLGQDNGKDPMDRILIEKISLNPADALEEEIKAFLHSVATRDEPVVSGRDGRNALRAAIMISDAVSKTPGPEAL